MQTIHSVVKSYMAKRGWRIERRNDHLVTHIQGDHGCWRVFILRNEDDRWLVIRSVAGFNVPSKHRRKVTEFAARVNYGMILGYMEFDMTDGEIAYKTSLRLPETELTHEILHPVFQSNFATFDQFLPGLYALVYGGRNVPWAMELCGMKSLPTPIAEEPPQAAQEQTPESGGSGSKEE